MAAKAGGIPTGSGGTQAERAFRATLYAGGLIRSVMQPYFLRFGISGSQWGVLRALHRAENEGIHNLRLTELSQRLLVQPPSTTGVVDRLQKMGLVARCIANDDARARQVSLTSSGRDLVQQVLKDHSRQVQTVMAGLTEQEQQQLQCLAERLGTHLTTLMEQTES